MNFTNTSLFRRTLAEQPGLDTDALPREWLRQALFQLRERAALLAGEISRDLPEFTVHDVTHLDALWEMADLIAGPNYPITPLEAFALGGVFLLHDLGLSLVAFPGGRADLQNGPKWLDTLNIHLRRYLGRIPRPEEMTNPPPEIESAAIQERLRIQHAERSEELAVIAFPNGEYLIENSELRYKLGSLLGKIAHSHWWPVSELESAFKTEIGALHGCPGGWTLDPLKVASLLRVADAAHLDSRRAPSFLFALRQPSGISREHWEFQSHLGKPQIKEDRLLYTTAQAFSTEESDSWWRCQEHLRIVDEELHQVDALLADVGRPRFQARSVAGIENPLRLSDFIKVSGWTPVTAKVHVSDVADLVRRLGGEQLYGKNPSIPLRELIQNAADAIRARRILDAQPSDWGEIVVRLGRDSHGPWLDVEDSGIGMSEQLLCGTLLDFGKTYWGSDLMRSEHEGLWAKNFDPSGHYGIGFFSVFMWGHRVRVTSRPWKDGQRDTRVLEFRTGLDARPLLRPAKPEEYLRDGGTRVRVWMQREPKEDGGILRPWRFQGPQDLGALCAWIAPALDVNLSVEDENGIRRVVTGNDWLNLGGTEMAARISCHEPSVLEPQAQMLQRLSIIRDSEGRPSGRAAIHPDKSYASDRSPGVVTVGGLRADALQGITGILLGSAERAARDRALPSASASEIAEWASDQAHDLSQSILDLNARLVCAAHAFAFGGNPADLPIAKRGRDLVTHREISEWKDAPDEIVVFFLRRFTESPGDLVLHPFVLGTIQDFSVYVPWLQTTRSLTDCIRDAVAHAWGCKSWQIKTDYPDQEYEIGNRDGSPERRLVTLYRRPV